MCLRPVSTRIRNIVTGSAYNQSVPCGKCIECLKRKQNDYAFILSQHALTHSKLDFVTLTYRSSAIPFSGVFEVYDTITGEVLERSGLFWLKPEYHDSVASEYYSFGSESGHQMEVPVDYLENVDSASVDHHAWTYTKGRTTDFVYSPKAVFSGKIGHLADTSDVRCLVSASLCRNDVKLCLKNARVRYKRLYGNYPQFTYFEVGEYGTRFNRPHFHLLFFDAPDDFLILFRSMWTELYGNTDHDPVVARGGDTLDVAHEKVAKYLAKYLSKGMFEKPFVRDGYVEKPRRISSKGIGYDRLSFLRSYCLAFDVFGEYDPDCPPSSVLQHLDIVAERRYYSYMRNGVTFKVKIPKLIYEKVLSRTYGLSKDALVKLGFRSSKESPFVFRVSHQRSLLSLKIRDYTKKHYQDLIGKIIFQASNGRTHGPSSLRFRDAYAEISRAPEKVRITNASIAWQRLRDYYSVTGERDGSV